VSQKIRRTKPYVCVDCDFEDHFRFQATKQLNAAAGAWLRCLAHSRAQEQDGVVRLDWIRRHFVGTDFHHIEDLVAVGLLHLRADGEYEIHAYAPRNQTRAMVEEDRRGARLRMRASRKRGPEDDGEGDLTNKRTRVAPNSAANRSPNVHTNGATRSRVLVEALEKGSPAEAAAERVATHNPGSIAPALPSWPVSSDAQQADAKASEVEEISSQSETPNEGEAVTPNKRACSGRHVRGNSAVTSALVPTSTSIFNSISSSSSASSDLHNVMEIQSSPKGEAGEGVGGEAGGGDAGGGDAAGGDAAGGPLVGATASSGRRPLPPSERNVSGNYWLAAFADGVSGVTGGPYTAGREFLSVLERIVDTHVPPPRDVSSACAWLREQARAFATQWKGVHPPKGLNPDGLERWLNEGRLGPHTFGKKRIQQLPPEEYVQEQQDDLRKYGAEVVE
jgi:hypothetical protein